MLRKKFLMLLLAVGASLSLFGDKAFASSTLAEENEIARLYLNINVGGVYGFYPYSYYPCYGYPYYPPCGYPPYACPPPPWWVW